MASYSASARSASPAFSSAAASWRRKATFSGNVRTASSRLSIESLIRFACSFVLFRLYEAQGQILDQKVDFLVARRSRQRALEPAPPQRVPGDAAVGQHL